MGGTTGMCFVISSTIFGVFLFPLRFRFGNKEPGYGQVGDECDLTLVIMTGWERCGPRAVYVGTTYCPVS